MVLSAVSNWVHATDADVVYHRLAVGMIASPPPYESPQRSSGCDYTKLFRDYSIASRDKHFHAGFDLCHVHMFHKLVPTGISHTVHGLSPFQHHCPVTAVKIEHHSVTQFQASASPT